MAVMQGSVNKDAFGEERSSEELIQMSSTRKMGRRTIVMTEKCMRRAAHRPDVETEMLLHQSLWLRKQECKVKMVSR